MNCPEVNIRVNVGATKPEEYGYYFWWGDTIGYKYEGGVLMYGYCYCLGKWLSVKDGTTFQFNESNCRTYNKDNSTLQSLGYIDSTGNLIEARDAATKYIGTPWRMPTDAEFSALINNCTSTWTTCGGVKGRLVTGKGIFASRSIFLPATGFGSGTDLAYQDSTGNYWSSSSHSNYSDCAWTLRFDSETFRRFIYYRNYGFSIRPVREFAKFGVVTTHLSLDCQAEPRTAMRVETITYSSEWVECDSNAVAKVLVNGAVISSKQGAGVVAWEPQSNGDYTLTHTVTTNGIQVGETLMATFVVSGFDSIPDLGDKPTEAQVSEVMSGSADTRLTTSVANGVQYVAYRTWATNVQSSAGGLAGTKAVHDSPHAWLSYALDSSVLLTKAPAQGEMKINAIDSTATAGVFDLSVAIDGVTVGNEAAAENLATLFSVEGCSDANGEYKADNVAFTFGSPKHGKVKITAEPKDKESTSFFMRVRMTP